MATSKFLVAALLLSAFLLQLVQADQTVYSEFRSLHNCASACAARCRLASRQKMCHRACGTCCARCNCVPPGTSGNQEMCPCYYKMTTHGGRRKCP
ncbi:Gibberellin regulated protein [Dillenia turbinata]|uniref:Gibberellin regulated protein n=1 Tax=Dillenia turbinata TaxID=194707 RepID=A0AAN8W548_9MAGN